MTENTMPEAKNKGSMKNVSKGPYRLVDGELSGKGGAPIAAFITGFTMSRAGVFGVDENNQADNAKLGLDAFRTFRSTKRLPSQLAADLHAVEQEAERLRAENEALKVDAARWREAVMHVGAENQLGRARYVIRYLQAPFNVMRGSVAEHFTKTIDAARTPTPQAS